MALVLGGAGIIGVPVVRQLISQGRYQVHSVSLERATESELPDSVTQYIADRNSKGCMGLLRELSQKVGCWDLVVDLVALDSRDARETYSLLKGNTEHFITISTTLVYDRTLRRDGPISESCPLAKQGQFGGYVDGKVDLEHFWQSVDDVPWTLLRPYHVLGARSLLGCIPEHNRDPKLLERLAAGDALRLCNGGEVVMNYVHPKDISAAICRMAGNPKTFMRSYNLVNPTPILVRDYYSEVARQTNATLKIENVPIKQIWEEMKGWEMTTLPHLYDMERMHNDIDFVPGTSLSRAIEDAIKCPCRVCNKRVSEIPVHQRMNKLPRPKPVGWLA